MMRFEELAPAHATPFLAFAADLRANDPATFSAWFDRAWDEAAFAEFARECATARRDWRPKAKQISTTHYLLLDDDGVAGGGILRFPLTDAVESTGGNLVAIVPPSRRGRGFGTLTLNRMLFEAARAGLARARVTCPEGDAPARRMIERNGGAFENAKNTRARYWIPLR